MLTTLYLFTNMLTTHILRSRCPNHLNLPHLTTSATLCTPKRLYKSRLCFLSFSNTSISPSSAPSSPDYADSQPSMFSPICQQTRIPSKHLLKLKSTLLFNFTEMPLHLLWTHPRHSMHKIELLPTPSLQTPHGCTLESSTWPLLTWHHMIFV